MSRVLEVKHGPELCVWVRFRDLIQRGIILVDDLVYGRDDSGVLDRPPEVAGGLASHGVGLAARVRRGGAVG